MNELTSVWSIIAYQYALLKQLNFLDLVRQPLQMHDFHSVYIQLTRCLFVDQSAANDSSNDESDDDNSEDSDGYDDGVSSSFNKEKLTTEIRNSMVKLIAVCGLCIDANLTTCIKSDRNVNKMCLHCLFFVSLRHKSRVTTTAYANYCGARTAKIY